MATPSAKRSISGWWIDPCPQPPFRPRYLDKAGYPAPKSAWRLSVETGGRTVDYTYDNLYRLTSETIAGDPYAVNGRSDYTMDVIGNRLRRDSTILPAPSAPDPLEALQSFDYSANDWLENHTYDDNGNTLGSEAGTDTYDFQNRLIRRETPNGDVIDLTYNAFGDRIRKEVGRSLQASRAVEFHIDRNNLTGYAQVVEELRQLNGSLTVERTYLYALDLLAQHQLHPPGALEAWLNGTSSTEPVWQASYYLYDGLGTVRGLANDEGFVTDAYFYDAYGVLLNVVGTTPNAYLYTGEQWDADLGMYFLRARYMEPRSGRFWTMDSYEGSGYSPATLHKYTYASGVLTLLIDPTGEFSIVEMAATVTVTGLLAVIARPHIEEGLYAIIGVSRDASYLLSTLAVYEESVALQLAFGLDASDFK